MVSAIFIKPSIQIEPLAAHSANRHISYMDWMLTALILTTAPNFAQSHSHNVVLFPTEKSCTDAAAAMKRELGGPAANGMSVEVRVSCSARKDK